MQFHGSMGVAELVVEGPGELSFGGSETQAISTPT